MLLTELNASQLEATEKARPYSGFAFFSEQRTGKSLAALAVADERRPDALLIVCPAGSVLTWLAELKKHIPDDWGIDVYVVSMQKFTTERHAWKKWAERITSLMMVVDEGHRIKKRGGKWSKACRLVGKRANIRLALTGTPIAQGIQDAWALFDFIQPGLLGNYEQFEEKYLKVAYISTSEKKWKKIRGPKPGMLDEFNKIYHKYVYRITLNEARRRTGKRGIMTRRVQTPVKLDGYSLELYMEFDHELEATFGEFYISVDDQLAKAMKLQQICGGFIKDEDDEWRQVGNQKLVELIALVLIHDRKQKLVIVCRFIQEILAIEILLKELGRTVLVIRGGHPYQGEFNVDVIIIQVQSGVSIDLSPAKVIIFYSCDYSYIDFEQISYRIRSYDTTQVTEYFLICTNTVDELIYRAVTEKKKFADLINEEYRRRYDVRHGVASTAS